MKKGFNLALSSYENIFKDDTNRNSENVCQINIDKLKPYENQPFKVLMDESMDELVDSIKENGVLNPVIARPINDGNYEILSGHRRIKACKIAGIEMIPVIVKDLDDDTASILLVDSNLHRETILPSEKAFAYKMRLDAMKRKAGRRTSDNLIPIGQNSRKELSEQTGESAVQIQRYIRLTSLIESLLDMVDNKKIPLNAAVELSYISKNGQETIAEYMTKLSKYPSIKQASELRKAAQETELNVGVISDIMQPKNVSKAKITLTESKLRKYFPKEYSSQQMEEILISLLENWSKQKI